MKAVNILCDRLPDALSVDGVSYPILTDFRRWIVMLEVFDACRRDSDEPIDIMTAARCAERLVLGKALPRNLSSETIVRLLEEMAAFAVGGDIGDGARSGGSAQAFDFNEDASLILSSFLVCYGIDLTKCDMHWWKFLALLRSLPIESDFMKVVRLRVCDTAKIADDELRRRVRRAKASMRIRHTKNK